MFDDAHSYVNRGRNFYVIIPQTTSEE